MRKRILNQCLDCFGTTVEAARESGVSRSVIWRAVNEPGHVMGFETAAKLVAAAKRKDKDFAHSAEEMFVQHNRRGEKVRKAG